MRSRSSIALVLVTSIACSEDAPNGPAPVEATSAPALALPPEGDASGAPSAPASAASGSEGDATSDVGNAGSGTNPPATEGPNSETGGNGGNASALPANRGGEAATSNGGETSESGGALSDPSALPTASAGAGTGGASTGGAAVGGAGTGGSTGGANAGGTTGSLGETPVERHGQLRVSGNRLHDQTDQPVTLRGQGFGWDNWWPQYYNADVVNWLGDDWCVDIVRPAMGIEPEGAYLENPDASEARIRAVVDAAIDRGLYVIIDWHAHDEHRAEAIEFFSAMAATYAGRPHVIYEVFNEPEGETWPEVKAYAEAVIAAIREHDTENLVIVGSPEWDQRIDLAAADPITSDQNVVYSVHFYASTHDQWLRERTSEALASGIPVLVSESSGSEAAGTGANDYTEWQAWFDFMDENGISWINYSVSDKEGETISVLEPGAPASGGWDASQLTETGEYIRDVFRSYCD
jgi:endoglucanase